MNYLITKYGKYIKESVENAARIKVAKAVMWININMGFYAEILSHLSIFGSYDLEIPTMCTDCQTYVAFHPDFVMAQTDEAIRFTLIHEVLHVIGQHNDRKGNRDHSLWNEAADYAINPIIMSEQDFSDGKIKTPVFENDGTILYNKDYAGMRAEDIYELLEEQGKKSPTPKEKNMINKCGTFGDKPLKPAPGTQVQTRIEEEYVDPDDYINAKEDEEGKKGEEGKEGEPKTGSGDMVDPDGKPGEVKPGEDGGEIVFRKTTTDNEMPEPGEAKKRSGVSRENTVGDVLKDDAKEVTVGGVSKVLKRKVPKKTDWDAITRGAMARNGSGMTDATRKLISSSIGDKPAVDWQRILKKFFDYALTGNEIVLPNRRLLGSGLVTYGNKKVGTSNLKTIVAAVDTSGSISEDQKMTFINEVMFLSKQHNADKMIIIYCSDDIDGIDIIKKGGKPDFSKMKSTGGNAEGFTPPFEWLHKQHIKPSVMIYLTDTGGTMPDKTKHNISSYMNKVIWFVCATSMTNPPPFGKVIFMPVASIKPRKK